jgi:hypothetical protein
MAGGLPLASYLTAAAGEAAQYRLIVDVLLEEQQRSLSGVSRADLEVLLRQRLGPQSGPLLATLPLDRRLDELAGWGVADQWPAPAGGRRYQLTEPAAQLHRAVRQLDPGDPGSGDPGSSEPDPGRSVAASYAPPVLAAQIGRLATARPDQPGEAAQAWSAVRTTFGAMTDAAAGWQARLAAALAGAADPARVAARQDTLRRYVDVWGTGVDRHSGLIAARAAGLLDAGPASWRAAALHSLGAAAPEDRLSALLGDYRATLTGLLAWFGPGDNAARRLRRQMRDVVVPLARGRRAVATVRGQLSQRADLLALAGALERSATDDSAWSLWCAATGLFAARHLPHASPQPPGPAGSVSFWTAEPVPGPGAGRCPGRAHRARPGVPLHRPGLIRPGHRRRWPRRRAGRAGRHAAGRRGRGGRAHPGPGRAGRGPAGRGPGPGPVRRDGPAGNGGGRTGHPGPAPR